MATSSSVNVTNSVLDVGSIVDNLINYESAPVTNMQSQVTKLQSKVTAYQALNTKLSTLSDKLNTMLFGSTAAPFVQPYSFADRLSESIFSKCNVTSSSDDIISATATNATISGSYAITVTDLAQAQAQASSGFASSSTASIGTGTLTIKSGTKDAVTISIGSSNNTLVGLRDAINNANAGVTATIVNDGSATPYRLLLRANDTGTANTFTVTNNLSGGQALNLAQTQAASDAVFSVNGLSITKSSNTVSDVIDGVSFTLKQKSASPVNLKVDKDVDSIVSALKEFVTAYNAVSSYIGGQFAYNAAKDTAGVLAGDATLRTIQSRLQSPLTQSITNKFTSFGVAGRVGLEFNRDGSLTLNESELKEALADDFAGVAALFLGDGTPSGGTTTTDSRVNFDSKTAATQNGTYSIQVDTLAQQASLLGAQMLTTLTSDETLTITAGSASAVVPLLQNDSFSTVLSKVNAALSAQNMAVTASDDGTGRLKIATNDFGSLFDLTVVSSGSGADGTTGFGSSPVTSTGVDIAGKINGHDAIGSGLFLTGAAGQPEEGLSLRISQTSVGNYGSATVASDTKGTEGASVLMNLFSALDGLTDPLSGPIQSATDGLNRNITALKDNITSYQARLEIRREILTQAYNEADQALRLMAVKQSQLSSQLSSLSS